MPTRDDLRIAADTLAGHTLCLSRQGDVIVCDARGIAPMMELIANGADVSGYSAADKIVGKAAAALFIKCGIANVYAEVMSVSGKALLDAHGIYCEYKTLTHKIINRAGTDICPMERAVQDINDIEDMYIALKAEYGRRNNGARRIYMD